jgi:membrane protease YdiL (CAAX protease family)
VVFLTRAPSAMRETAAEVSSRKVEPMPKRLHKEHDRSRRTNRTWRPLAAALLAALAAGVAWAQVFSADRYLQECLRFEAGRDFGTARQSCLNALEAQPGLVPAELALGRIELELGEFASAESRISRIRDRVDGAEPLVLLAELAYHGARYDEAVALSAGAATRLARDANLELSARIAHLDARLATRAGRFDDALLAFERAIALDGLNVTYRLGDAGLRFRLGDTAGALEQLQRYRAISGDATNPDVTSLQGRVLWAEGAIPSAIDHIESALAQRNVRDSAGQSGDLRVLALLYYAQGDLERGGIAAREAMRRGNLLSSLSSNGVVWLLALVALLLAHLIGESRHGTGQFVVKNPDAQAWSVGRAYGVLVAAVLVALAVTLVYSLVRHDNVLALLTPVQQDDARAVYLIAFALTTAALSWQRLRRLGVDAGERLLGTPSADRVASGVAAGLAMVAVVVAYFAFTDRTGVFGGFFVDLARPTVATAVALALVPVSELYFRGFLYPALARRYDARLAVVVSGLVFGLAFGTPVLLMVLIGLGLAELHRRRPHGLMLLSTVVVGWIGLVLVAALSPTVRSLFFG